MRMRSMVDPQDPRKFAPWVRELRGVSGVYRIAEGGVVQYVGSAANGDLHGTLTRHVQAWNRRRTKASPGHTFDRFSVTAAVEVTASGAARAIEELWIQQYQPVLNLKAAALLEEDYRNTGGRRTDNDDLGIDEWLDELVADPGELILY